MSKRGATPEIHNQIIQICKDYEKHLALAGQDCRTGQPTPGNKQGDYLHWKKKVWDVSVKEVQGPLWKFCLRQQDLQNKAQLLWILLAMILHLLPQW